MTTEQSCNVTDYSYLAQWVVFTDYGNGQDLAATVGLNEDGTADFMELSPTGSVESSEVVPTPDLHHLKRAVGRWIGEHCCYLRMARVF